MTKTGQHLCVTRPGLTAKLTAMKPTVYFRHGHWPAGMIGRIQVLALGCWLALFILSLKAADTNALEIQSIEANGGGLPFRDRDAVKLGEFPKNIVFNFGAGTNVTRPPLRMRYTLEGYENTWHEGGAEMDLTVRFYNSTGDQISQNVYRIHDESTGWTGSLKTSSLTHRRETLVVPPLADRLLIVISSAGPPDTVGIYVVANLVVSKLNGNLGSVTLLQSPFDTDHNDPPANWIHDGTRPSMAKIVRFGQEPQTTAFAILDEDPTCHGEWHNILETAPVVKTGDSLVVEWNEMYTMGSGTYHTAIYDSLPAGHYRFRVRGLDAMGVLTGVETSVGVVVPAPYWTMPWFWGLTVIGITVLVLGISRYFVWHRMRLEMVRIKHQRALEQERLRIAHDIHDDLGARVTQISLLSAMAHENATFPDKARADFDKISKMSRELVAALYETVWAVNPENDNLEAQGNYLCQMVNQLCERTPIRCRFNVLGLPHEIQVSSQTRHNINMAVKEAVHNVIKHSDASEISVRMAYEAGILNISVEDNGAGFPQEARVGGHGINNMKQRLANIGGTCYIESKPGKGTTVLMRLAIKPLEHAS
jgi:signal transduction histidine kinase